MAVGEYAMRIEHGMQEACIARAGEQVMQKDELVAQCTACQLSQTLDRIGTC